MKRAGPPRAVVFDLDGTLLDSLPLVLEAIAHAIEPYGRRPTMEIFALLGGPPERFLPALLTDLRDAPIALQRMEAYHRQNSHLIRPFDGAAQLLGRLARGGVRLAVWTGRDRASADGLLRRHGLYGFFSAIVCGDDLPTHKPDPAGLREIMRRLDVTAADTVMVGDADVDVLGGAASGVDTLLIRHGREVEGPIAAKCWRSVASPTEAFDLVLRSVELAPEPGNKPGDTLEK